MPFIYTGDTRKIEITTLPEDIETMFIDGRVRQGDRKEGLYYYEMRHGDDDMEPCSIEPNVFVNFFGTLISNKPIDLGPDGSIEISEDDWGFIDG